MKPLPSVVLGQEHEQVVGLLVIDRHRNVRLADVVVIQLRSV